MKIASFNINNINRRLTNLLNWLREAEPDIVCLQELKAADSEFPTLLATVELRSTGQPRAAVPTWTLLRARVALARRHGYPCGL